MCEMDRGRGRNLEGGGLLEAQSRDCKVGWWGEGELREEAASVQEELRLWGERGEGTLKQRLFSGGMLGCGSNLGGTTVVKGRSKGVGGPEEVWGGGGGIIQGG